MQSIDCDPARNALLLQSSSQTVAQLSCSLFVRVHCSQNHFDQAFLHILLQMVRLPLVWWATQKSQSAVLVVLSSFLAACHSQTQCTHTNKDYEHHTQIQSRLHLAGHRPTIVTQQGASTVENAMMSNKYWLPLRPIKYTFAIHNSLKLDTPCLGGVNCHENGTTCEQRFASPFQGRIGSKPIELRGTLFHCAEPQRASAFVVGRKNAKKSSEQSAATGKVTKPHLSFA